MKSLILALFFLNMQVVVGCKKNVVDNRSTTEAHSTKPGSTEDMVKGKEIAFTGYPDWCTNKPQPDGTTCIKCERTTGSKENVVLANLCFQPRTDFDPKMQCGLSNTKLGIKTLSCHGAEKDVTSDVSLPVDKAATVLDTLFSNLKIALQDAYKNDANSLSVSTAVITFAIEHREVVLTDQDQTKTATDLVALVNPFLVTQYSDGTTKTALITQLAAKLTTVHNAFAGTGAFSAKLLFAALLDIAKVFPKERLGKAADVLTGPGIAKLLQTRKTELDAAVNSWSENKVGVNSGDDLLTQMSGN